MVRIPLVPQTWADTASNTFNAIFRSRTIVLGLWRLMLVVGLLLLVGVLLVNPVGAIAGFVIFTILGWVFKDEIIGTAKDLWYLRFWGIDL